MLVRSSIIKLGPKMWPGFNENGMLMYGVKWLSNIGSKSG